MARPVRPLRRWSRSWARAPPPGSAVAPPQVEGGHRLARAAHATERRRWHATRARCGHTYRTTCPHHPWHVLCGPSGGGLGHGRVLRRPEVRLHRRKSKAAIGSLVRLTPLRGGGGTLPALVAGIPTAPLAHTIHGTSCAAPPAVVSVMGACSAARKCGCTAASRRRSSAR